jgi:hypothetical protein
MTTYTAADQINRALRLIGMLAEGELPSTETATDCLTALNQMIDSWNTERLSTFVTQDQVFTWPSGFISRTLGPSGDFVGLRPVLVDDATYFKAPNGVSYGIKMINQQQYNGIAVKTVTSTYPQVLWVNMGFPDITLTIYPRPTQDLEWHIVSVEELNEPATLNTTMYYPPGYLRAFTYNLAMEIAPEFGVEPSPQVQRIAMTSKRDLKRINNPDDVMALPYALVANRQRFNIYSGNF